MTKSLEDITRNKIGVFYPSQNTWCSL